MKLAFLMVGKTAETYFADAIREYERRIKRYVPFEIIVVPDIKGAKDAVLQKQSEGELILRTLRNDDFVVLLDEHGKEYSSVDFAGRLGKLMGMPNKRCVFVIGGAYGFSNDVRNRGNEMVSLSKMTFSHQLVRVVFTEQLYRAFTILNNQPYHHE